MGCQIEQTGAGITVIGPETWKALNSTWATCLTSPPPDRGGDAAEGTTVINNIAHLRIKECDRLSAVVNELRKMGAEVEEEPARMIIHGRHGAAMQGGIATYNAITAWR